MLGARHGASQIAWRYLTAMTPCWYLNMPTRSRGRGARASVPAATPRLHLQGFRLGEHRVQSNNSGNCITSSIMFFVSIILTKRCSIIHSDVHFMATSSILSQQEAEKAASAPALWQSKITESQKSHDGSSKEEHVLLERMCSMSFG